jgi:hypothetical protein
VDARRDDVRLALPLLLLVQLLLATGAAEAAKDDRPRGRQQYGAIAYHHQSKSVGWATDRNTGREARVEALKQCGHEKCVVAASVTRGCAALARDQNRSVVQRGATQQEAETKALGKCGKCEIAAWVCTR